MRVLVTIFFLLSLFFKSVAQDPVRWEATFSKEGDLEYLLTLKATIDSPWKMYSQFTPDGGPLPTEFTFNRAGTDYQLLGSTEESKTEREFSDVFGVDEIFFKKEAIFKQKIQLINPQVRQIDIEIFYQACIDVCINRTTSVHISLDGKEIAFQEQAIDQRSLELAESLLLELKNKELLKNENLSLSGSRSLWRIFALGFFGGLLALLTPCVFPMIPLTVSFFTKQSQTRAKAIFNATAYGLFIILIYVILTLPFHIFESVDPQILNNLSTNVWLNLLFFFIFLFFAFSFFGYYELTLPSSWANRLDKASSVGGLLGIFFMAAVLAVVSFSCTGPILGGLLGSTTLAQGNVAMNLSIGVLGFGVALALPFSLFALFPSLLNNLPRSGGWMNTFKVTLGFIELALAFKFFSKADLVGEWGILKREVFIGIWVIIGVLMILYYLGKLKFPHESNIRNKGKLRLLMIFLVSTFVLYLIPGLTNTKYANLKLLSGFPPPLFYSIYTKNSDCPLNLPCFKDFRVGLEEAKKQNKAIMLDFTGWGCENCRRMEEKVWSTNKVFSLLNENFIIISLYVDEREELPKEEQFLFPLGPKQTKNIRTIGDKWSAFQTANFGTASQPYYVLLSNDLELLNSPIQYTDLDTYEKWLKEGLKNLK